MSKVEKNPADNCNYLKPFAESFWPSSAPPREERPNWHQNFKSTYRGIPPGNTVMNRIAPKPLGAAPFPATIGTRRNRVSLLDPRVLPFKDGFTWLTPAGSNRQSLVSDQLRLSFPRLFFDEHILSQCCAKLSPFSEGGRMFQTRPSEGCAHFLFLTGRAAASRLLQWPSLASWHAAGRRGAAAKILENPLSTCVNSP